MSTHLPICSSSVSPTTQLHFAPCLLPFLTLQPLQFSDFPFKSFAHSSVHSSTTTSFLKNDEEQIQNWSGKKTQRSLLEQLALEVGRKKAQEKPTAPAVEALTWALSEVQEVSDVEALLQGLQFSLPIYCSVIHKFGGLGNARAAFVLYQWLHMRPTAKERPNIYCYNSLLSVMKAAGDDQLASLVVKDMKMNGVDPDVVTCNIMIGLYEQRGSHLEALRTYSDLQLQGVCPDIVTYKTLLSGFEKSGDIYGALDFFKEAKDALQETGPEEAVIELEEFLNGVCRRTLYNWFYDKEDLIHLVHLLQKMDSVQLPFSPSNYKKILRLCLPGKREKDHLLVKVIYTSLRDKGLPIDTSLCNQVIRVLGRAKKWWAALEVFEHMMERGPQPDKRTFAIVRSHFNFLLNASRKRNTFKWSLQLLEKMEAKGFKPDAFAFDTVLVTCAKAMNTEAAVFVFKKMIEHGQKPSILSYGALLSALEKGLLYEKAEQVWMHMKKVGLKPNVEACTTMISIYGGAGKPEELVRLVADMKATGITFSLITFNALITACAKIGDGRSALDWLKQMKAAGVHPDSTTYDQLVKALAREDQAELARDMYIRAKELGLTLSPSTYDRVLKSCRLHDFEVDMYMIGPRPSHHVGGKAVKRNLMF